MELPKFQSTPSPRRATTLEGCGLLKADISIHALPAEGDRERFESVKTAFSFQSTPSPRRATRPRRRPRLKLSEFQSTPSPRRATRSPPSPRPPRTPFQSTPSPRRATPRRVGCEFCHDYFNPRPPRGGRPLYRYVDNVLKAFQSTPSPRRATLDQFCIRFLGAFQSTPSPRRATFGLAGFLAVSI